MKQMTIRLNDDQEKELEKIKKIYNWKSNQKAIEQILLTFDCGIRQQNKQGLEISRLKSVISYLEEQLKVERWGDK